MILNRSNFSFLLLILIYCFDLLSSLVSIFSLDRKFMNSRGGDGESNHSGSRHSNRIGSRDKSRSPFMVTALEASTSSISSEGGGGGGADGGGGKGGGRALVSAKDKRKEKEKRSTGNSKDINKAQLSKSMSDMGSSSDGRQKSPSHPTSSSSSSLASVSSRLDKRPATTASHTRPSTTSSSSSIGAGGVAGHGVTLSCTGRPHNPMALVGLKKESLFASIEISKVCFNFNKME